MAINAGRVVGGGLVTGVLLNVCDFVVNGVIMKDDMNAMFTKVGMDPAKMMESWQNMIPFFLVDFVLGLLMVWTYALIRPRVGAGPKAAVVAAFIPFVAVTATGYFFIILGLLTSAVFLKASVLTLVGYSISNTIGCALYKET